MTSIDVPSEMPEDGFYAILEHCETGSWRLWQCDNINDLQAFMLRHPNQDDVIPVQIRPGRAKMSLEVSFGTEP